MAHLTTVGPVHTDIVSVGVFLKNPHKFAELRPMQHWVALSFALGHTARHRTITRKVIDYNGRYRHVANLKTPGDFDEPLQDLLTQAYNATDRD